MTPAFDELKNTIKSLPGFGYRSAERLALHLILEKPEKAESLVQLISKAVGTIKSCITCHNLSEEEECSICKDPSRNQSLLCVVERVSDLISIERSGSYRGLYHVLGGKLSPLQGVHPDSLNFSTLENRLKGNNIQEIILALSNDIEGEATCHYIQDNFLQQHPARLSRIAFGLPSGGGIHIADAQTLQSAINGRQGF